MGAWLFGTARTPAEMIKEEQKRLQRLARRLENMAEDEDEAGVVSLKRAKQELLKQREPEARDAAARVVRHRNYARHYRVMQDNVEQHARSLAAQWTQAECQWALLRTTRALHRLSLAMPTPQFAALLVAYGTTSEDLAVKQATMEQSVAATNTAVDAALDLTRGSPLAAGGDSSATAAAQRNAEQVDALMETLGLEDMPSVRGKPRPVVVAAPALVPNTLARARVALEQGLPSVHTQNMSSSGE